MPGGIWREVIFLRFFGKFSFLRFLVILPINFERNSTETFALLAMWNHGIGPKKGGKGVIWGKSRGYSEEADMYRDNVASSLACEC